MPHRNDFKVALVCRHQIAVIFNSVFSHHQNKASDTENCRHWKLTLVGSSDRASSQQFQMWFSEHIFAPKLAALFVTPIVSATVEQIRRGKMSEKPHSIWVLRWFNFSQSGSRKNNRKVFEGASMEPTNSLYRWMTKFQDGWWLPCAFVYSTEFLSYTII